MNNEQIHARAASLMAGLSNKQIVEALQDITSRERSAENNRVRIWLIDEIEARFPAFEAELQKYYEENEGDYIPYSERLIQMVKESENV